MSFTGLKKKTAFQFFEKQLKKLKKDSTNTPEKIKTIGVLADSRLFGSYDISRNLSQKLNLPHKNFEIIIFENLKDDFVTQHYNTFSEKDFGMYGKIKTKSVKGFVDADYDLLINYCNLDSVFANIVAVQSKAKFKVGFADEQLEDLYDFMIVIEGNKIDVFNDELAKYLQILELI
jgi:hypothetical protein